MRRLPRRASAFLASAPPAPPGSATPAPKSTGRGTGQRGRERPAGRSESGVGGRHATSWNPQPDSPLQQLHSSEQGKRRHAQPRVAFVKAEVLKALNLALF